MFPLIDELYKVTINLNQEIVKGIESLPQTQIFKPLYLGNLMVETFDISNLDYLI